MADSRSHVAVAALAGAASSLSQGDEWADLLADLCAGVRKALGFDRCSIALIEDDEETLRVVASNAGEASRGSEGAGAKHLLHDLPTVLQAAEAQSGLFFDDASEGSPLAEFARLLPGHPEAQSACVVPLRVDGKAVGFIHGSHVGQAHRFDAESRQTIAGVAQLTAMTLELAVRNRRLLPDEPRYRELVELSGDFFLTFRPDGEMTYVSPAALRLCSTDECSHWADLLGKVHPEDRERTERAWQQWLSATELTHFENRMTSKLGTSHRVHWNVYPVRGEDGQLTHIQCIGRDLTERYKLEEKLRQMQRSDSVARLAQGFSHKFNNILVSVLGNASVLAGQLEEGHAWRPIVDDIATGAEHAAKLTRQLLAYSRSTPHVPQRRRLRDVVQESLELSQASLPLNIRLRIRIECEEDWVEADAMQLGHALLNLIWNAAEAMPEGGTVVVRTELLPASGPGEVSDGGRVALVVEDTGMGIVAEDRERIFDPFFSTKEMGRGLGLSVVQGIVQAHGGEIEIQSQPGEGTTVRLLLPPAPRRAAD